MNFAFMILAFPIINTSICNLILRKAEKIPKPVQNAVSQIHGMGLQVETNREIERQRDREIHT